MHMHWSQTIKTQKTPLRGLAIQTVTQVCFCLHRFFFLAQLELNLWEVDFTSQSIREKNPVNVLLITVSRLSYWLVLGRYKSTTQESPF